MLNTQCLNEKYSTTRMLCKIVNDECLMLNENGRIKEECKWSINNSKFNIQNSKLIGSSEDKFETMLFLPEGEGRKGEGGLRPKGYFKFSYENLMMNDEYLIMNDKYGNRFKYNLSNSTFNIQNSKLNTLPLISIITVVYNGEKYLEETIQSVINQIYPNVEYIIIDGGSTDETLDIIKKYEDKIDYWVSEKDKGIYDAMNKGIDLASVYGLIFLNAGDYFVGNVISNNITIPSFLKVKYINFFNKLVDVKIKNYKLGLPNCHQGIIFENKKIKYDLSYKIASDYEFYLKHNYKILPIHKSEGYVYYDNSGFSKLNRRKRDKEIAQIIYENFGKKYYLLFNLKAKLKYLLTRIYNGS